ncbi:MAG: hypothetical protein M3M96_02725, partial [Candidatus Eremiobacteraeota bacterium]|nr:hypothetical protein [Candidatus Eremiobacteraeota bacterium]
ALPYDAPTGEAFLAAGKYLVENSDILFAVWDGEPSRGIGGTADVVSYARSAGRHIVRINPKAQIPNFEEI